MAIQLKSIKETLLSHIEEQIDVQNAKGLPKYGHTLDEVDYEKYDWLEMANQELIDLAQYQQTEIRKQRQEIKRLEAYIEALEGTE